jgi:hypothetical protein
MAHPLHTTVEDFVAGLLQLKQDYITLDRADDYVKSVPVSKDALAAYTWWSNQGCEGAARVELLLEVRPKALLK